MFRKTLSLLILFVIVAGGGYIWLQSSSSASGPGSTRLASLAPLVAIQDVQASSKAAGKTVKTAANTPAIKILDPSIGAKDAPVTILEYLSFTCPHCAEFHDTVYQKLKSEYVDTGKVRFVVRDVYFDRFGLWASMLARCEPSKFFGISDLIFRKQREWLNGNSNAAIIDNLRKLGRVAGLSPAQMTTCLKDDAKAKALVLAYQKNAEKDHIPGTPTFFINGKKYPNMTFASFKTVIDGLLAKKK